MKKLTDLKSLSNENELNEYNLPNEYIEDFSEDELMDENEELYKWLGILLGVIWILSIFFY